MIRHPSVVLVTAGQRRRPSTPSPQAARLALPEKKTKPQTGYTWPERGAIETLFQEAKKFR